jgi:hypothetical protein
MKFYTCKLSNNIPKWMYGIRAIIMIVSGICDIFLVPFGKCSGYLMSWQGQMLRTKKKAHND